MVYLLRRVVCLDRRESYIQRHERRLLVGIAMRLGGRIKPDVLTAVGLGGAVGVGVSYWASQFSPYYLILACVFWVLNWLGDSMDGTVARVENIERPRYGFYIDHCVDMISVMFVCVGLGLSGAISMAAALALLATYYLVALFSVIETVATRTMDICIVGIDPTSMRIVAILYSLALMLVGGGNVVLKSVPYFIIFLTIAALFVHFVKKSRALDRQDRMLRDHIETTGVSNQKVQVSQELRTVRVMSGD